MILKKSNHRDRKYLDLAHKVNECQMKLPGVCIGYSYEGCEPAHSNNLTDGKGQGLKSHDYKTAALCPACHKEYDNGKKFDKEAKRKYFEEAWKKTIDLYFKNGWVRAL